MLISSLSTINMCMDSLLLSLRLVLHSFSVFSLERFGQLLNGLDLSFIRALDPFDCVTMRQINLREVFRIS